MPSPAPPLLSLCRAWHDRADHAEALSRQRDDAEATADKARGAARRRALDHLTTLEAAMGAADEASATTLAVIAALPATSLPEAAAKLAIIVRLFEHEPGLEHRLVVEAATETLALLSRP